ncbi:MAG: sulfide/dihydroorotate dehydrogenase-like FAD/NAD-binding protein [Rhodospirillaceae bacterium]|jgi:ferredoxin--NADP+ reductase|nr:sulfide/dihydroorotate dehydrogenase-like FAD/NAD-binding protein [Rhodospirillaceae bacterium]MBT6361145.1 sulfide/dihydroorotate dehydrogenase-like FAD/NAD-binding protein [Rhodospirillaceae bacterium]
MARILEKRSLTPVTNLFVVEAPLIAAAARPGQFVIVRVHEGGERIPLTIADYNQDRGEVTIVVQQVGVTTNLLGALREGDDILDMVGPLGVAPEIEPGGHVVGVGGGFGAAALLCLMRDLTERGDQTTAIIGARQKELLLLTDELGAVCGDLELCTDDGSAGFKGFVTERLQQIIDGDGPGRPDKVVAIGPMPMMRAVAETTRAAGIETLASMDPLMIDGTGMCGGCRITIGGEVKFACVDGPFFDAHQVDFDEAVRRNKMYADMEKQAAEKQAVECQASAGAA